jgi:hypothetical protein
MDELFRFNIVRPPNGTDSRGVPLDYATLQSPYPPGSFLALTDPAATGAGGGGARGNAGQASRKDRARAAAAAVQNIYGTQSELRDDPLYPKLQLFLKIATQTVEAAVQGAGETDHALVNIDQTLVGLKADDAFKPFSGGDGLKILGPALMGAPLRK